MLDLLLINPGDSSPYPAMGLAELAAFVRKHGFSVSIIDFSLPRFSEEDIQKAKAKVIGVSVPCGLVAKSFNLADLIKKNTESVVVFGGYYPTFCYEKCLENNVVDYVIIGEGELPLVSLLKYLVEKKADLSQIPGVAYREKNQIRHNPRKYIQDINLLPMPASDLLHIEEYPRKNKERLTATLSTGRGCPFGCSFCSQSAFWERKVRFRSPEKVLQLVDKLLSMHPVNYLRILDDIFPIRRKEAIKIARGLKERGLLWECQARIDVVDKDLLQEFAETGLDRIFFGIESGSPKIQEVIGKKLDLGMVREVVESARRKGIKTKASFQLGSPGETKEDVDFSIALAKMLDVDEIALFVSTPFPGTPLYDTAQKLGLIKFLDPDSCDPSIISMGTGHLSMEEVEREAERFLAEVPSANWGHHSKKGRRLRRLY